MGAPQCSSWTPACLYLVPCLFHSAHMSICITAFRLLSVPVYSSSRVRLTLCFCFSHNCSSIYRHAVPLFFFSPINFIFRFSSILSVWLTECVSPSICQPPSVSEHYPCMPTSLALSALRVMLAGSNAKKEKKDNYFWGFYSSLREWEG